MLAVNRVVWNSQLERALSWRNWAFLARRMKTTWGHFLGLMRVADAPHRDGIDESDVPRDQRGTGLVGMVFRAA